MSDIDRALAHTLARAKAALADATKIHRESAAKVEKIAERISETTARREAITADRLAGKSNPSEAAEFHALSADQEALTRLHAAAQAEADALQPAVEAAQAALARAENEWQHHQDEAIYHALLARAREHEEALLAVVKATVAAGKKIGHRNTRQSWTATHALERAMAGAI